MRPGGSPCWTGGCAPRRSLQPCRPAKPGEGMRGCRAPPMSPPLLPTLLSIHIHPPLRPANAALLPANTPDCAFFSVIFCASCVQNCVRLHPSQSAPTCATAFSFFLSLRKMDVGEASPAAGETLKVHARLFLRVLATNGSYIAARSALFFVFPSLETCVEICAQKCTADRERGGERERWRGMAQPHSAGRSKKNHNR